MEIDRGVGPQPAMQQRRDAARVTLAGRAGQHDIARRDAAALQQCLQALHEQGVMARLAAGGAHGPVSVPTDLHLPATVQGVHPSPVAVDSRADSRSRYDQATAHLDPPLAIVDLDAFDANAAALAARSTGKPLRVASKSVRCRELIRRVLDTPGWRAGVCGRRSSPPRCGSWGRR